MSWLFERRAAMDEAVTKHSTQVENISRAGANPVRSHAPSPDAALLGIYEISKILNSPARLEQTLGNVVNVLSSFLDMKLGMIVVLDAAGDPEIIASAGWAAEAQGRPIETLPRSVIDRLVATMTPIIVEDVSTDPLFAETANFIAKQLDGRVSFLGVPIKSDDKVIGTLSIDRTWDGAAAYGFDGDLRFLTMVANLVGQTVRLHRMLSAERKRLLDDRRTLEKALDSQLTGKGRTKRPTIGGIVGESPAIRKVFDTIAIVAKSNSTVLLRGESGTGKEMFARAVHDLSTRKAKPFVKLNCAALPESVLESELFGHERGAFTGAVTQRAGRFELAHGGTLLLDEIGEISSNFQAKLLRVLQEGEFERVGGARTLKVDVRLIFATNKNLEEAVAKGEFRSDLYYRISVVPVFLPPLRERPGDVSLLAHAFLDRFNTENERTITMSASAIDTLQRCYFPGNVRELENCVRRTATLARGEAIINEDFACASGNCLSALLWTGSGSGAYPDPITELQKGQTISAPTPPPIRNEARPLPAPSPAPQSSAVSPPPACGEREAPPVSCEHADAGDCPALGAKPSERERLIDGMERAGWVQAKAARLLGLTPRQIGYALKKHNIELKRF
jgi:Nif-specific regulatory protein